MTMWPGVKYFEAHITLNIHDDVEAVTAGEPHGFKWSQIAGDEVMGPGTHGYLTRSDKDFEKLKRCMECVCANLEASETPWLRRKIEGIIIDERPA